MLFKFATTRFILVAAGIALLVAAGCSPTIATRGNIIADSKLQKIQPTTSSRADVEQAWGPPTSVAPFDPNTWYYIGETTAQEGIFAPKVESRKMIRVTFDANDMVMAVTTLDPSKGKDIAISDRQTPTAGKEFTAFQQFVGNLGKYNSSDDKKSP